MSYEITLTREERKAMEWVGNRYRHGYGWASIIGEGTEEWDCDDEITFKIPEHKAWEMKEHYDECNGFLACFDSTLTRKFDYLMDSII